MMVNISEKNNLIIFKKFEAWEPCDDREYIRWYAYKDTCNRHVVRAKEIERIVNAW